MFSFKHVYIDLKHRHKSDDIENFVRNVKQGYRDLIALCYITGTH